MAEPSPVPVYSEDPYNEYESSSSSSSGTETESEHESESENENEHNHNFKTPKNVTLDNDDDDEQTDHHQYEDAILQIAQWVEQYRSQLHSSSTRPDIQRLKKQLHGQLDKLTIHRH